MSYRSVATLTVVGQANKRVSKELMWAPAQGDDLCIRNDETPCAWRPPPVKQAFPLFYTFVTHDTPDLAARYELRERLVRTPNEALFLGALSRGRTARLERPAQPEEPGRRAAAVPDGSTSTVSSSASTWLKRTGSSIATSRSSGRRSTSRS